jgi:hypothetical protein
MARNGHGLKAVESKEPNELYDRLSQDRKDNWDEIGSLGYKPEQSNGVWFAHSQNFKNTEPVGPSESLSVLVTMVRQAAAGISESADAEGSEDISDLPPSDRLPGMEEPAIDELDRQADNCIEALERRKNAVSNSKDQDDIFRNLLRKHGRKRYARRGWALVISESEKLDIKKDAAPKTSKRNKSTKQQDLPAAV